MKVEALMTRIVTTCRPEDTLDRVARVMWDVDCGCVPVVQANGEAPTVVGMITDRDICMAAYTQGRPLAEIHVSTTMSQEVCSCGPRDTVQQALKILQTKQLHRLPVIDDHGQLVGMIALADVVREAMHEGTKASRAEMAESIAKTLGAISAPRSPRREVVAAA